MKKKFRFLPHTADVYIEAWGEDLEEAFANTAIGMENIITNTDKVGEKIKREVAIQSEDEKALLFDFLTQFLIWHDAENLVFSKVVVERIWPSEGKLALRATVWGEPFDPTRHESGTYVKAVSYMEMEIKREKGKIRIRVLVDI